MKRKLILFTCLIFAVAAMTMSNNQGVARVNGLNLTGSDGGATGCEGSGCHNGGNFNNDSIPPHLYVTDVNNNPVNWFFPSNVYIIRLRGTSTAPKWGFQISVSHTYGGTTYPAGLLTEDPPYSHDTFVNGYPLVEQNAPLTVVNNMIETVVYWTAPIMSGVDTVNFRFTICNANGDGTEDGDNSASYVSDLGHWTTTTDTTMPTGLYTLRPYTPVKSISASVYPNPLTDRLNISLENADMGMYSIKVFDGQGRTVATENAMVTNAYKTSLSAGAWAPGMYHVMISKGNSNRTISVIKL